MLNIKYCIYLIGEWYISSQFGDRGDIDDVKWERRKAVVQALLETVPSEISLQIRAPFYKFGVTETEEPLTKSDYRDINKNISRIGTSVYISVSSSSLSLLLMNIRRSNSFFLLSFSLFVKHQLFF